MHVVQFTPNSVINFSSRILLKGVGKLIWVDEIPNILN